MTEEITTTSWLTRIKDAFIGILFGIALIIGAIVLVFWNEGHSLHIAQSLDQTKNVLISVPNTPINNQNNQKVVYFSGLATTKDNLVDSLLGITLNAINLHRKVEMYQWKEHTKTKTESQIGGSEKKTTTYTYEKTWSESLVDSSNFKTPAGHQNPTSMPIQSELQYAKTVTVGDFSLPNTLIEQINISQPVDLDKVDKESLKTKYNKPVSLINRELFLGQDSEPPQPGDLRINLTVAYPQTVSLIGQQKEHTVQPYLAPAGESIMLLSTGQHSPAEIFQDAKSQNSLLAWILRLVSLLMLVIGFSLIMKPLVVIADVLPFLGFIVNFGTGFVAFICGASVWIIVTAIAWFATRPLVSVGLLVIMVIVVSILIKMRGNKTPQTIEPSEKN